MSTKMNEADWGLALEVFRACLPARGAKARDDRLFLEALHHFEDFFAMLAGLSGTAHLVQMFDSTVIRAHVSAAGAKGGKPGRRSDGHAAASAQKSI